MLATLPQVHKISLPSIFSLSRVYQAKTKAILLQVKNFSIESGPPTQDLEIAESVWKTENWTRENLFDIPPFMPNMIVVRLNGGGLLLYAPVKGAILTYMTST